VRGPGAADGRRMLSHVRNLRHPRRIIVRHGLGDAPRHCHLVARRPRAAVPTLSWGGVPPTAAEDIPARIYLPATVVAFFLGQGRGGG